MNIIDIYAKNHGTNRYKIAKFAGIAQTTLANFKDKNVDKLTVKTVRALALGTHTNPGDTLDELIKISGNPIIQFIRNHKNLDKDIVKEVEDLIIWHGMNGGSFNNISFNRYYNEGEDTDERANEALKNVSELLNDLKENTEK